MEATNVLVNIGLNIEQFIDNEFVKAYFYPDIKLMHYIWQKQCTGDNYKKNFQIALDFAANHDANYFLSDIRMQGAVSPDDRKWFENVAIPGAIERGLKKAGVIFDGNAFKMYYLNMLLKVFAKKAIPMKLFNDTQIAINWLIGK